MAVVCLVVVGISVSFTAVMEVKRVISRRVPVRPQLDTLSLRISSQLRSRTGTKRSQGRNPGWISRRRERHKAQRKSGRSGSGETIMNLSRFAKVATVAVLTAASALGLWAVTTASAVEQAVVIPAPAVDLPAPRPFWAAPTGPPTAGRGSTTQPRGATANRRPTPLRRVGLRARTASSARVSPGRRRRSIPV